MGPRFFAHQQPQVKKFLSVRAGNTSGPSKSGTLHAVNPLLIAGIGVAGLVVGGVLDPVGQRRADRSREEDRAARLLVAERKEAAAREALEHGSGGDGGSNAPGDATTHGSGDGHEHGDGHENGHGDGHGHGSDEEVEAAAETEAELEGDREELIGTDGSGAEDDEVPEEVVMLGDLLPEGRSVPRTVGAAVATGLLFAGTAAHFGAHLVVAPFCIFFAVLVVLSVTDLTHRMVPRQFVYAGSAVVAVLLVITSLTDRYYRDQLPGAAIAGVAAFAVFFTLWWFVPRGMGYGDVRVSGFIGMTVGFLSILHAYVAFLSGFLVGLGFGLIIMAVYRATRKTRIPFAPALAIGAVIGVFWGAGIAQTLFHASS